MKIQFIFLLLFLSFILKEEQLFASTINNEDLETLTTQTNLALRQVGHKLLKIAGNDTLTVPPIRKITKNSYFLPITQSFNYDTLPFLLQDALATFDMEQAPYYVTVKDCSTDTLILGYDFRQFKNKSVPCIGRIQYSECNHIYVTFPNRKTKLDTNYSWIYPLASLLLIGFAYFLVSKRSSNKSNANITPMPSLIKDSPVDFLPIGQCQLDVPNQHLYIHNEKKELTYRETKLLQYFGEHPNQLLNRETLLEKVWEDEGVIVGRSLDVFVSRLRKILKPDNSLTIKTVHGIGYRLEIEQ